MQLSTLSGKVSGLAGNLQNARPGANLRFRIGGRPATAALSINLVDGDLVTAVGTDGGEFTVHALRNDTTNAVYAPHEMPLPSEPIGIIFGIITLPFLVGFLILWGIWKNGEAARKTNSFIKEVNRLLAATPPAK